MKKLLLITILPLAFLLMPSMTFAQPMMRGSTEAISDGHTASEEAEGKEVWEKLQAKQLECKNLTDDNFETLGEYFMGQMLGSSHEAMNTMMERMMGKSGKQQMHIVMGKRLSGCNTSASYPNSGLGFMPMMWMMRGGGNPAPALSGAEGMGYGWNNMMGGWGGFGTFSLFGSLTLLLLVVFLVLGSIYFWKEINKK